MKNNLSMIAIFLCSSLPLLAQIQTTNSTSHEKLVNRIVTSITNVKAGELVFIYGGKESIELMESIAEQVHKKGAVPQMILQTEKNAKARILAVPEGDLVAHHKAQHKLDNIPDLAIRFSPSFDGPAIEKQASPEYVAKKKQVRDQIHGKDGEPWFVNRDVLIQLPTSARAKRDNVDFSAYQKMVNEAIAADYSLIAAKGKQLSTLLKNGKKLQVTSANGTNFSVNLDNRPVSINDGIISDEDLKSPVEQDRHIALPAGMLITTVNETSATGKVTIPKDRIHDIDGIRDLQNFSFDLVNGKIANFKSETHQEFMVKKIGEFESLNQFSGIIIGFNPAMRVMQDFRPYEAEGHVALLIGGNDLTGGKNTSKHSLIFHVEKATVSIDGKVIIKDGKLMLDKLTSLE